MVIRVCIKFIIIFKNKMIEKFFACIPFEETRWILSNGILSERLQGWETKMQPLIEMDWKSMNKLGLRIFVDRAMQALAKTTDKPNLSVETPARQALFTWNEKEYIALLFYASDEMGSPPAYQFMFKHSDT